MPTRDDPRADALGNHNHRWVDTRTVEPGDEYRMVDLFAGAGGLSLGFEQAGFRPVVAVEKRGGEPPVLAEVTYRGHFPDVWVHDRGIETLSDRELLSGIGDEHPHVVAGGHPCQAYSSAGFRDPDDPRGQLYLQFLRVVGVLQPEMVVIENVPGLLTPRFRPVLDDLMTRLGDLGYAAPSVLKLNAAQYGVPQFRHRVVIVACHGDGPNPYPAPLLAAPDFVTVRDAIGDLADLPRDPRLSHDWPVHRAEFTRRLGEVRCGEYLYAMRESWRRLRADRPAHTVKTNGCIIHPWLARALSIREMARLQSFPDSFLFRGCQSAQMTQIGNAVPPLLARHMALAVRAALNAECGEGSHHVR